MESNGEGCSSEECPGAVLWESVDKRPPRATLINFSQMYTGFYPGQRTLRIWEVLNQRYFGKGSS